MGNRDETQIERILHEIEFIRNTTINIKMDVFLSDELLQHAITMSIITIGECANHLSDKFIEDHPELEWHKIIAVRNIAAHGYWQLNMQQIWIAVITDIPKLKDYLLKI